MMTLRYFTRAIPRSISKVTQQYSSRSFSALPRQSSLLQTSLKALSLPRYAAFSTTRTALDRDVDPELSHKLETELQLEMESRDSEKLPSEISDFLENGPFQIHDTPGQEEVYLTRKYGDETIRISFSVADLNSIPDQDPDEFADDDAQFDEDPNSIPGNAQSGGGNTKGAINQGVTSEGNFAVAPEDRIASSDTEEPDNETGAGEQSSEPTFPVRVNVVIDKKDQGSLHAVTTAQDGEIVVENVFYLKNAELAEAKTAEISWKRKNLYEGPPFGNLDEDLQVLMERYLDERGINTALALFVPEYVDFKEQREYVRWLSNVKTFVDA